MKENCSDTRLADGARLAHLAWLASKDFRVSLRSADHAVFLEKNGFGGDLDFAAEIGVTHVVPELHDMPGGTRAMSCRAEDRGKTLARPGPPPGLEGMYGNTIGDNK